MYLLAVTSESSYAYIVNYRYDSVKLFFADRIFNKASWILDRCGYATLSIIDEQGFPQSSAINAIPHHGIREIWMTTYRSSAKAAHISSDSKAGISFVREAGSVSLTGKAEAGTDENYCLIRFPTLKAILRVDGRHSTITS